MTATIREAPLVGASGPTAPLENKPLTVAEAEAIVRDFLAAATGPPQPRARARRCRCGRPWLFDRGHCSRCGRDLRAVTR